MGRDLFFKNRSLNHRFCVLKPQLWHPHAIEKTVPRHPETVDFAHSSAARKLQFLYTWKLQFLHRSWQLQPNGIFWQLQPTTVDNGIFFYIEQLADGLVSAAYF